MSARQLLVATAATAALALPTVAAGPASGTTVHPPDVTPQLLVLGPPADTVADVLRELIAAYAVTHLPSLHNEIVLILHNPASAVL
jgi:hypothetical protein